MADAKAPVKLHVERWKALVAHFSPDTAPDWIDVEEPVTVDGVLYLPAQYISA